MGSKTFRLEQQNYARPHKTNKGFTLIELVLVLVLIAILISAAIFGYIGYQRMTNNSAARQNFVVLMAAKIAYCSQDNGVAPTTLNLSPFVGTGASADISTDFSLSGTAPLLTINACNSGATLTYSGNLFGNGTSITCTNAADTPVVISSGATPTCTLQ